MVKRIKMKRSFPCCLLSITLLWGISCTNAPNTKHATNQPAKLIEVFHDDSFQLTGIAVSREGRLFTNYPLWSKNHQLSVIEISGNDGMEIDRSGNVYLGDLQKHRIIRIDTTLKMNVIIQDDRLIWPDSYQISQDNFLYISCSQIDKQPDFNEGINKRTSPYMIFKIKLN
jgi:hypothetical protein